MKKRKGKYSVEDVKEGLRFKRPTTKKHLRDYIKVYHGVQIPDIALTKGHTPPMDYVWYAFNADFEEVKPASGDAVVIANRGGGKTMLSGILTLLDCVFKPGCQVRILSGSSHQAGKMYEHFGNFLKMGYEHLVEDISKWPSDITRFKNGSVVEVLQQSEKSVRGEHVHKLRCDEVELFREEVYNAAQYTTMSTLGLVPALEAISTQHKRYGLMRKLVKEAERTGRPIFKWNVWDVIEKCYGRKCSHCPLYEYCEGKAKKGEGYYPVSDVITTMGRTKPASFEMEMLCGERGKKKGAAWRTAYRRY